MGDAIFICCRSNPVLARLGLAMVAVVPAVGGTVLATGATDWLIAVSLPVTMLTGFSFKKSLWVW